MITGQQRAEFPVIGASFAHNTAHEVFLRNVVVFAYGMFGTRPIVL